MKNQLAQVNKGQWSSHESEFQRAKASYSQFEYIGFVLNKSVQVLKNNYGVFINDETWCTDNKESLVRYLKNLVVLAFAVTNLSPDPSTLEDFIQNYKMPLNSPSFSPNRAGIGCGIICVSIPVPWSIYLINSLITKKNIIDPQHLGVSIVTLIPLLCFIFYKLKKKNCFNSSLFHTNNDLVSDHEVNKIYNDISELALEQILEKYKKDEERTYLMMA
ncbi:MAG: hypothetical protein COB66_01090 [Coxiella sp. (in: Bacteria)]|nr:MAG: hypothetical protein COB66_01090 [Coxiella sp. (in: g-proteobacteria)]